MAIAPCLPGFHWLRSVVAAAEPSLRSILSGDRPVMSAMLRASLADTKMAIHLEGQNNLKNHAQ